MIPIENILKGVISMIDTIVKEYIHQQVIELWKNDIQADYNSYHLLKEDSLKNAFYYHLRRRLGDEFLRKHQLHIYTEFNNGPLKGTGKRADIAIVQLDENGIDNNDHSYIGDYVSDVVAIFELKYKNGYNAEKNIQADVRKLHSYIKKDKIDCMYYLVAISEMSQENNCFIKDNQRTLWAKGKVTELVGIYKKDSDEVEFDTFNH